MHHGNQDDNDDAAYLLTFLTYLLTMCLAGPMAGPENISVRPVSSGSVGGRQRGNPWTTNDDNRNNATATDDDEDGARDVAGSGVTLMITWNVHMFIHSLFLC